MAIKKIKWLELGSFSILALIFILILLTPYLINRGFSIFEEELVEMGLILILYIFGFLVVIFYRHELKNKTKLIRDQENRLEDAFKYIGQINVQIEEIRSVFTDIKKYPENKKDFKYILQFMAKKILGIVPVDWVLIRIINNDNLQTIREHSEARGEVVILKHEISNNLLIQKTQIEDCIIIPADRTNLAAQVFCILPKIKLSEEQKIFITAIINQLQMMFVIFTSEYYKNSRLDLKST